MTHREFKKFFRSNSIEVDHVDVGLFELLHEVCSNLFEKQLEAKLHHPEVRRVTIECGPGFIRATDVLEPTITAEVETPTGERSPASGKVVPLRA